MEGLGGYASSDDEGPSAAAVAGSAAAASNHFAAASSTPVQPAVSSSPATVESVEEKAERKRAKQAKKEKKAAKAAAAASIVPPLSSLNAPLPTPKLALPSASSLLASSSTKGVPSFLAHGSAARAQETLEALAEEAEMMGGSGGAIVRSEPRGILRDAAARAMEKQAAEERAERDRTKLLSSAPPHAGDKRAVPSAPLDLDDRAAKKPRAAGEGEGPARRNQDTMQKEKEKRAKGQSGVEGWKPEAWMKMRQDYD